MASLYGCQRCSRLPPPPMFNIGPPPNVFSIEAHCSPRLSSSSPSIKVEKSNSSSIPIVLGILIAVLIFSSTFILIKKRLVNRQRQRERRRRRHKTTFEDSMMISSSSVKFNRHHQHDNHHQNWTKLVPLLSDSCSSDQTSTTPPNEYPCSSNAIEPLLIRDNHHEYEQIKSDDSLSSSLHYYCLIYCRQCANYHPTSSSSSSSSSLCPRTNLIRPSYLPLSTNPICQHQCACYHRTYHPRHDNRFFEHPTMFMSKIDNQTPPTTTTTTSEDLNPPLSFIRGIPPSSPI